MIYVQCKTNQVYPPHHPLTLRHLIPKLVHELFVEVGDPANPFGTWSQERRPDMQASWLLAKPRAWNNADTGRIEKPEAVEFVRLATLFLGLLAGFLGNSNGRE